MSFLYIDSHPARGRWSVLVPAISPAVMCEYELKVNGRVKNDLGRDDVSAAASSQVWCGHPAQAQLSGEGSLRPPSVCFPSLFSYSAFSSGLMLSSGATEREVFFSPSPSTAPQTRPDKSQLRPILRIRFACVISRIEGVVVDANANAHRPAPHYQRVRQCRIFLSSHPANAVILVRHVYQVGRYRNRQLMRAPGGVG